jgi:hypothetical protein
MNRRNLFNSLSIEFANPKLNNQKQNLAETNTFWSVDQKKTIRSK